MNGGNEAEMPAERYTGTGGDLVQGHHPKGGALRVG